MNIPPFLAYLYAGVVGTLDLIGRAAIAKDFYFSLPGWIAWLTNPIVVSLVVIVSSWWWFVGRESQRTSILVGPRNESLPSARANKSILILPLATVALGAILSLGIAASLKWMQPSVYKPFSPTYYALKEKLGAPKADAEPVVNSYIAQHYNETAIWIERPFKTWFFLAFHSGKWSEAGDPYPRENSTFFNDDCNRKRFGTPKGFYPPYGGLAVLWEKNVVEWKDRMGWRRWHCHHGGVVYLQKFDGGYILGPFSSGPDKIEAQIFVLTNDQKWLSREALEVEAPSCMVLTDPEATGPCPIPIEPLSQ